jgi:hypothetical protein
MLGLESVAPSPTRLEALPPFLQQIAVVEQRHHYGLTDIREISAVPAMIVVSALQTEPFWASGIASEHDAISNPRPNDRIVAAAARSVTIGQQDRERGHHAVLRERKLDEFRPSPKGSVSRYCFLSKLTAT